MRILISIFFITIISACGSKALYDGDAMANYPNLNQIWKENVEPYQKGIYTYQQVIIENSKKDTSILKAEQVDWKLLKQAFSEADIYKKEFDRMYKVDVLEDEMAGSRTFLYTPLDVKAVTKKLSLNVRASDNAILSVYAETNDVGLFNSKSYKLLLATGKTIQVQERSKKPFSKAKHRITNLTFLN
jgi:hypothetical protein